MLYTYVQNDLAHPRETILNPGKTCQLKGKLFEYHLTHLVQHETVMRMVDLCLTGFLHGQLVSLIPDSMGFIVLLLSRVLRLSETDLERLLLLFSSTCISSLFSERKFDLLFNTESDVLTSFLALRTVVTQDR